LSATALAVETRDERGVIDQAVFVSCDLSAIRRKLQEDVRRRVKGRAADLDVQKILISATHTHTAPALTDAEETDLHPYDFMGSWAYRIPFQTELAFQHRAEVVPLPVWKVSAERYAEARAVFEAGEEKTDQLASRDYINWRVSRTLMVRHSYSRGASLLRS